MRWKLTGIVLLALALASGCSSAELAAAESKAHAVIVKAQAGLGTVATNPAAVALVLDEADALGLNTAQARAYLTVGNFDALGAELARLESATAAKASR